MKKLISRFKNKFHINNKINDEILKKLYNFKLPDDYLSFLKDSNGGEGFIGDEYLILWKAEELEQFNIEYEVKTYAKGILLFGSNGGGEGFGFDTRSKPYKIVEIPFIGMDVEYAIIVADSFSQFLERMERSSDSLI